MKDDHKTKKQLIDELTELRSQDALQKESITGSISAELAADEARRYAESIVETVRDPLLVLDADLKIISANRNFYRTFKVIPGETIGSFIYDLGNKQWDIPKLRELLEEVLPEKEAFDDFEVEHTFQDIGHKIMLLNARQIYRKDINTKIILLAIEDITERRKLEEANNNLAAIVESADDAIIGKDLEGIIVSWNRGAEIAYGYNAKEVIGKSISLLMPPGHPDEYKELLTKRSSGELIKNYESQRTRKDGKIVDVSLTISPVKDTSGEITGDSIIARDITERKRLEDLLTESEERYRRLFETASDGIVLLEKREGKITHANPATEKMLGYSKKDSIGHSLQDIGILLDMGDFPTTLQNLNKIGISNYDDVPIETKSGQHIDTDIYLVDRARLVQCNIRDITEHKRAGEVLRESEEKYRSLVENISDVIYELDSQGVVIYISPVIRNILGYDSAEIVGKNFIEFVYKDDWGRLAELFSELSKGIENPSEYRVINKSGEIRWVRTRTRPIMEDGFFKNARGTLIDVTDRRQAEEALRKSEEKYRWVLDNMADVIAVMDMNLRFTYVSPSIIRMRGYTAEEATAQTFEQVMTPESLQIVAKVFEEEMKLEASGTADPGRSRILEVEQYKKDGSIIWMENHLSFMRDENQKAVGIISLTHDITDRKRAEEVLRESEERYRVLFEGSTYGILITDIGTGRFVDANLSICRMLRYSKAELLQLSIEDIHPKDLRDHVKSEIESQVRGGQSVSHAIPCLRKDGTVFYADIVGASTNFHERRCAVGFLMDITDRKQVEDDLKQSEQRYRSIFENAQEGIFRSTPEGKLIMANQAMANMFGYESPEEEVASITEIVRQHYVNPEDRDKLKELIEEHGFIKGYEVQLYRKDGSIIWISATMHAVRDEKGNILYYDGIDEDITNRKESAERIKKALGATVQAIAVTVETRDPYTAGHQRRVADLVRAIATEMNLPIDQINGISIAAAIHDLGKISVPAEILSKPTKLTALEFSLIKTHAQSGYDILKDIDFPWPVARTVLEHHEKMNGSGYPNGLTGDNVLLESRILSVADVVESMASHRPYRPSLGIEAALEKNRGTLYDTGAVDACLRVFREKGYQLQ